MQAIITILVADALAWFYADTIARKDNSSTYAFSGLVRIVLKKGNFDADVKPHQDNIHRQNSKTAILVFALIATVVYCLSWSWEQGLITFFNCGFIYWLWFDVKLGKLMGKGWWYLGFTAKTDRLFKNGKIKAIGCGVVIVALHVTYFLW